MEMDERGDMEGNDGGDGGHRHDMNIAPEIRETTVKKPKREMKRTHNKNQDVTKSPMWRKMDPRVCVGWRGVRRWSDERRDLFEARPDGRERKSEEGSKSKDVRSPERLI